MMRKSPSKAIRIPPALGLVVSFIAGLTTGALIWGGKASPPSSKPAQRQTVPAAAVPAPSDLRIPKGKGKIAIVLDDWGYSLRRVPALAKIQRPLTLAVLPNLLHSGDVARAAEKYGHQVILHMPMQAKDPNAPRETGTILVGMSQPQVLKLLDQSLRSVPGAVGISNHQGSKATSDRKTMEAVLREVKNRKLFFLDSYVTKESVCPDVARRLHLPFAQRSVFLDNTESAQAIQLKLIELAGVANQRGYAVGIGHDRAAMMEVLQKAVPALEEAGYTLVPVSELLKK